MINVEIYRANEGTVNFPAMMESIRQPGLIVLFSEAGVGTVVSIPANIEDSYIGDYSQAWCEELFVPFYGEVTLSNGYEDPQQEDALNDINTPPEPGIAEKSAAEELMEALFGRIGVRSAKANGPVSNAG